MWHFMHGGTRHNFFYFRICLLSVSMKTNCIVSCVALKIYHLCAKMFEFINTKICKHVGESAWCAGQLVLRLFEAGLIKLHIQNKTCGLSRCNLPVQNTLPLRKALNPTFSPFHDHGRTKSQWRNVKLAYI